MYDDEISVKINMGELCYPITIKSENFENLREKILEKIGNNKFLVVISKKVDKLYAKKLGFNKNEKFVLPDGEKEKNIKNYQKIMETAQKMKLSRSSFIVAIGGGVVGDLAGFVASTYMRGINLIHVPTTLLAMVDSSIGGKTAIDTEFGKNLIGTFYQPCCTLINPKFLKTLDDRQFKTGLAEVIKYAFIEKSCRGGDFNLFDFLKVNSAKIKNKDLNFLTMLITSCVYLKTAVVAQDEHENGLRKILNFGHTYGHALEKYTNYKKYTHGEAIILGMKFVFNYAKEIGIVDSEYYEKSIDLINLYSYNLRQVSINKEKFMDIILMDKKNSQNKITLILPIKKGEVVEKFIDYDDNDAKFVAIVL